MTFDLYHDVALARDLPQHRLRRGDVVKLVERHTASDGSVGYSAEVFSATGRTLAVVTVRETDIETLREDEVWTVRSLAG